MLYEVVRYIFFVFWRQYVMTLFVMTDRFNRRFRFVMTRYFRICIKKETIIAKIGAH
jgi:hypothetical protein